MAEASRYEGPERDRYPVVVGIDGSDQARGALSWAADEAERRRTGLRILYAPIHEPDHLPGWYTAGSSPVSPSDAVLDDAVGLVATRHPDLLTRGEVVAWPPSLVLTVASRDASLLVVGARGLGGFDELLLGSVSDQCVQYAHCPVVVVHSEPGDYPVRPAGSHIVVGIDGSLGSNRALGWALAEARIRSAPVDAVYGWQYPPVGAFVMGPHHGSDVVAHEVVGAAREQSARLAPGIPFTATATFGAAVPTLLDACREADLLVVGYRGHGRFEHALLGSVAHQCARHARCAVVVTRQHDAVHHRSPGGSAGRSEDTDTGAPDPAPDGAARRPVPAGNGR